MMLKAVVVDDEYIVLQGLLTLINWHRYGIDLIGTADNGLSAMQMVRKHRPDLVLTDIRMPGMDGLRLIEEASRESPHTLFVVFSGFNEFEYVRRAIGLGVVDYLEKPVTVAKVDQALLKTVERILHQHEFSALKTKWEASQADLLEKATLDLLLEGGGALDKWQELFGQPHSDLAGVTVLAFAGHRLELPEHRSYRAIPVANGSEKLTILIHYELPADLLWEQIIDLSDRAFDPFGAGQTYPSLADAPKSYQEAREALQYGRFLNRSGLTRIQEVQGDAAATDERSKHEEAVLSSLQTMDREGLLASLADFESWIERQGTSPDTVVHEILKLIYLGTEAAKESGVDHGLSARFPHLELSGMHAREEMLEWLRHYLEALLSGMRETRRSHKNTSVEKALAYLEVRFGQDVSLQELAEHVGLNPSYFSLLFKEQTGVTYIKHLTSLRIRRAKSMLGSGMLVHEVSEKVGYANYRHFNEIFKKLVGMTPGQYRDQHTDA